MKKYTSTIFTNLYDNKTDKQQNFSDWDSLERTLYKLANEGAYRVKTDAPLISPAVYEVGTTRANANVLKWTFAIVDVDSYEGRFEDIQDKYSEYKYVCYSTASSTVEKPKFRLVFPLTRDVEREEISHFWLALNKEIGEIGDIQTKDLSRMFYIPSPYDNANNFIFSHEGTILDPTLLTAKHPYAEKVKSFVDGLGDALRAEMLTHRRGKLNDTSYKWSSYKDCPFVRNSHVAEYNAITDTGWYHKTYQIMVSIASIAVKKGYPITAGEIENLVREIDNDSGGWYAKRPLSTEANRAIDFVFKSNF